MDSSPEYFNEAIEAFHKVAEDNEVKYFLVGAYARDLFLKSIADNFGYRKTTDVDFAIMIDSWDAYQRFYNN